MAGAFIPLGTVMDARGAEQILRKIGVKAADLRPVFQGPIATDMASQMKRQFDSRGAHLGTRWPPLFRTTIQLRTQVKGPSKARRTTSRAGRARAGFATPMQDSRRLFFTLTRRTDPEAIRVYMPHQMFWGTRLAYAEPHHRPGGFTTQVFGKGRLVTVPQRAVIPENIPPTIQAVWANMVLNYVIKGT